MDDYRDLEFGPALTDRCKHVLALRNRFGHRIAVLKHTLHVQVNGFLDQLLCLFAGIAADREPGRSGTYALKLSPALSMMTKYSLSIVNSLLVQARLLQDALPHGRANVLIQFSRDGHASLL